MPKGIIYVMTTIVPGLIKIGKTGTDSFEKRMYNLEHNGYSNVTGLKRHFAIEVDDYDEKETLLDDIFSKSRVENTELFALDINLVVQLLSSFEGTQIYPKDTTKEEIFDEAANKRSVGLLPEGEYYFERKTWGETTKGTMCSRDGKLIVKKGSIICPVESSNIAEVKIARANAKIKNNVLQEDVEVSSPSYAAKFICGTSCNGWTEWKTKDGKRIDAFRKSGK